MDPVQNPFSPGVGTPPPELAGRSDLLEEARIMIGRALNGRSTQGMLMTGLRGVGKTVILNELMRMAEEQGVLPLYVEATAESTLSELLASELKKLFFTLNRIAGAADKVKKGLVVLRNFIGTIHLNVGDIGLDIEPFAGIADSGNIETDLAESTRSRQRLKNALMKTSSMPGWNVLPQGRKTSFMGCLFATAISMWPMLERFLGAVSHH